MVETSARTQSSSPGRHGRLTGRFIGLLCAVLAIVGALVLGGAALAPGAHSATGIAAAAAELKKGPVYVDPRASGELPPDRANSLGDTIKRADKPIFVAVLPSAPEFPPATVLQDLRSAVGITGVYAVQLGNGFDAGADPSVMSRTAVDNLVGQVERASGGDATRALTGFVDQAIPQAGGQAPGSWSGGVGRYGSGIGLGGVVVLGAVAVLAAGGGYAFFLRRRRISAEHERTQLSQLRRVVDEDITAYGEELDRLDFVPADPESDDAMRTDYAYALDMYERAKALMARAKHPDDVRPVTQTLEDGRFALATLDARRSGERLPERRPPCFFDPRHGPSVRDVLWAPPEGVRRDVPACAADATRIEAGEEPMARTVETASGRQPYWNAGPVYEPWAGGYFGGGLLPGLLVGTLLGGALTGPAYGYGGYDGSGDGGGGDGGDSTGGDYSGSDFDPGDFGGGDGFGGGGGDFGGGGF